MCHAYIATRVHVARTHTNMLFLFFLGGFFGDKIRNGAFTYEDFT